MLRSRDKCCTPDDALRQHSAPSLRAGGGPLSEKHADDVISLHKPARAR